METALGGRLTILALAPVFDATVRTLEGLSLDPAAGQVLVGIVAVVLAVAAPV